MLCDGRRLDYSGLSAPLDVTHQYVAVDIGEAIQFEVANGRSLDSYETQPRPHGWDVEDVQRYAYGDGELGLATLRIEQEAGFPPRILTWIGLELADGVARTAVQGKDYRGMLTAFQRLRVNATGEGLRIESPIISSPRPPALVFADEELEAGLSVSARAYMTTRKDIPRNEGKRTKSGALLYRRSEDPNSARILVSESAVAHVVPFRHGADEAPDHGYRAAEDIVLTIR